MLYDIATNLLANLIFVIVSVIIGWVLVICPRSRLLQFFNISKSRKIYIYLSSLNVAPSKLFGREWGRDEVALSPLGAAVAESCISPGGAFGVDGILRSFHGTAITLNEIRAANAFRDLFNYFLPALADTPNIISKILISDVRVSITNSPDSYRSLDASSTVVSLGSPGYNIASSFIEKEQQSQVRFGNDGASICLQGIPPITELTHGFVERVIDKTNKRAHFYVAGLSEVGTVGAARFLVREWSRLDKKYGVNTPFVVMLKFDPVVPDRWTVILER